MSRTSDIDKPIRLDKWLWAVRFYKTRSLAAKDCQSGKIKRNGKPLKAAASISPGDELQIPVHDGSYKREVIVTELLQKRVKASLAQQAYTDQTPQQILKEAQLQKKQQTEQRKLRQEGDQGRMTKKRRRDWKSSINPFEESTD